MAGEERFVVPEPPVAHDQLRLGPFQPVHEQERGPMREQPRDDRQAHGQMMPRRRPTAAAISSTRSISSSVWIAM